VRFRASILLMFAKRAAFEFAVYRKWKGQTVRADEPCQHQRSEAAWREVFECHEEFTHYGRRREGLADSRQPGVAPR
jgi:hypothetical protein